MGEQNGELARQVEELRNEVVRLSAKQQRSARGLRAIGIGALALSLVVLTAGRARTAQEPGASSKEIVAGKLTIVGADNKPRLTLDSDKDGGRIYVHSTAGSRVVLMGCDEDGGYLSVRDADNKGAAIMAIHKNGGLFNIYNKDDKAVVILTAADNGAGAAETNDGKGKLRARVSTDEDGGRLWLLDGSEKVRVSYPPK